jgi:hypothetical protein
MRDDSDRRTKRADWVGRTTTAAKLLAALAAVIRALIALARALHLL